MNNEIEETPIGYMQMDEAGNYYPVPALVSPLRTDNPNSRYLHVETGGVATLLSPNTPYQTVLPGFEHVIVNAVELRRTRMRNIVYGNDYTDQEFVEPEDEPKQEPSFLQKIMYRLSLFRRT